MLTAFAVAFCADRHFESFEEGLVWAVNLGGDADTNGAGDRGAAGCSRRGLRNSEAVARPLEPRAELAALSDRLLESAQS